MNPLFVFLFSWLLLAATVRGADTVIVFNELMYHPRDGDAVEWIELHNQMAVDVDVSGWSLEGVQYVFPTNAVIAGGSYVILASDPAEMALRTGSATVYGPFTGKLSNSGERLRLINQSQRVMDSVTYGTSSPWPAGPDGSGFSLAKRSPTLASDSGENWIQSKEAGGTPGAANFPTPPSAPAILLNEVAGSASQSFFVELANPGPSRADISGLEIGFLRALSTAFVIPTNTFLEPGGFYAYYPTGYVGHAGEKVFLYTPGRQQLLDAAEVNPRNIGRSAEKGNSWLFPAVESPGASNPFQLNGDVVINEILYSRPLSQTNASWIELFNRGTLPADLSQWKLSPVNYTFPADTLLGPGEYLVVAQDAASLRAAYPTARIMGNFSKTFSGSSDLIRLEDAFGNPVDQVRYFDSEPWPAFAKVEGVSLERRDPRAESDNSGNWQACSSPGSWQTYSYTATAAADGGPTRWNEFIFGLLDAGDVLLDDFSVIENPGANGREILQNGSFENGSNSWRFLGTHRHAQVIPDPDNPANHVLLLQADGPSEHMHNHVETTLLGNQAIKNGIAYKISWRAKWLAGSHRLNTRLYFNRVSRTTELQRPLLAATPGAPNSARAGNAGPTFSDLRHSPAVPKPTEAVQVSIHAQDPDGIKRCRLWAGVNGANWTALDMQAAGDRYVATLPARAAGTVVQFYVEAEDNQGAISAYPEGGPASRALYKVNDSQALSTRIHNFRLIMLPAEANELHAATNVMSNGTSLATVIYDESEIFYNCGLHLQASERGRMDATRVGFTVNFPADHLYRGSQNTITFDRSGGWSGRGGRQDEIVIRHIINQAGNSPDMYNDLVRVLTPLPTHTGTAMLLMSKYSNEFIDGSVFPKNGSLFKLELIYYPTTSVNNDPQLPKIPQPDDVIGSDIGNLGSSHEAYRWFLLAENRAGADDYDGLIRVAQAFSLSGAALQNQLSQLIDLEQWIRVFAFKSLSGDADTYGFGYPHNQLIYVPPAGKAATFPWDMDYSWARGATETINVSARIGQIIHGFPANQRLFLGNIQDIVTRSYNTNYMARWTAHYGSLDGQNYSGILSYIGQRAASARSQLPALSPFAVTSFTGDKLTTNAASVLLRGTAPYTWERLQLNANPPGAGFTWTAPQSWELTVPLAYGSNLVTIVGYDFHQVPIATNQVTIVSTFGLPDRDQDGMPDDWEIQMGLNPDVPDGNIDSDGDGLTNLAEYLAGTAPLDPASTLRLTLTAVNAQEFDLAFVARPGRAYRIQYRIGLVSAWTDLATIPSTGDTRVVTQRQSLTKLAPALFYRVVLQP